MDKDDVTTNHTFINGRAQIIEMLSIMPEEDREILLKNMNIQDPILTAELREKSLSIVVIERLSDEELAAVFAYIPAAIWGLTIKDLPKTFQKRSLTVANREYAEEAFTIMRKDKTTMEQVKRAQRKVVDVVVSLSKRNLIKL